MRDSAQIIHGFTPNALNIAAACALHSRCLRASAVRTGAGITSSILAIWLVSSSAHPVSQVTGATGCDTNIVSATVVATFCGHASGTSEILDLFILWRGQRGWFQAHGGGQGSRGSNEFPVPGGRGRGRVSRWVSYGPVTIGFQADFDAGTVSIGDEVVDLTKVNTVLIDNVDRPDARRVAGMSWTAPELPLLAGDMNLAVVRRSGLLRGYLQCQIPMPPPSPKPFSQQPPVITVCEKLKSPSNR